MNYRKYIYTKERKSFGRQCLYSNRNELIFSEQPHREYAKDYILKNPVNRDTQLSKQMALSDINTENVQYSNRGMNHIEGGWPKDVNMYDEEATLRYRKKIERDDIWGQQLPGIGRRVLASVLQNNAVNIYENYFEGSELLEPPAEYTACVVGIYRDQKIPGRPITNMSWWPTGSEKMVCTYTSLAFAPDENAIESYIWDLEDANKPEMTIKGPSSITSAEWNPRDEHMIAGGLTIGTVAVWDPRTGSKEMSSSVRETSHRERVNSLRWLHSKTNTEFFSGSGDGTVYFWDARILKGPIGTVIVDAEKGEEPQRLRAQPVSVLEFEFTIPTRYMIGTELGYIFIGNRKAMIPSEALLARWKVNTGSIYSLVRNPIYVKYFLVVGGWFAKICVEDSKDEPLIRTKGHTCELRSGTWSPTRCSLFFVGRYDGVVEFWDLLMSHAEPILEVQAGRGPIWTMKCSDNGKYLIVGTNNGDMFRIELSDALTTSDRNDRTAVGAMFERETRRLKLLEGRMREIHLKIAQEEAARKRLEEEEAAKVAAAAAAEAEAAAAELLSGEMGELQQVSQPIGRSVSEQILLADTTDEKEAKPDDDEEEEKEDEEAKTQILVQNAETLFYSLIDEEKNRRAEKSYTVIKTPFDLAYEREMRLQEESAASSAKAENEEDEENRGSQYA